MAQNIREATLYSRDGTMSLLSATIRDDGSGSILGVRERNGVNQD
jgi:hypothetical protein